MPVHHNDLPVEHCIHEIIELTAAVIALPQPFNGTLFACNKCGCVVKTPPVQRYGRWGVLHLEIIEYIEGAHLVRQDNWKRCAENQLKIEESIVAQFIGLGHDLL